MKCTLNLSELDCTLFGCDLGCDQLLRGDGALAVLAVHPTGGVGTGHTLGARLVGETGL